MFNIIEFVCTNIQPFPEYSHIEEEKSKKRHEKNFVVIQIRLIIRCQQATDAPFPKKSFANVWIITKKCLNLHLQ